MLITIKVNWIGYGLIILQYLVVTLSLTVCVKWKLPSWDDAVVTIKYPIDFLVKSNLTKYNMRKVVINT